MQPLTNTSDMTNAALQDQPGGILAQLLDVMGLTQAQERCDATVLLDLQATALDAEYTEIGRRYTGAVVSGTMTVSGPGRQPLSIEVDGSYGPEPVASEADFRFEESQAPFGAALRPALLPALDEIWGTGAVPALVDEFGVDRDRDVPSATAALGLLEDLGPAALETPQGTSAALPLARLYQRASSDDWYRSLGLADLALAALRSVSGQDLGEDPAAWIEWAGGQGVDGLGQGVDDLFVEGLVQSGFTEIEARCIAEALGDEAILGESEDPGALFDAFSDCGIDLGRLAELGN
jgi:hypothetical protein